MNIETDGTITPEEATQQASKMLIDYFSILLQNPGADMAEMPAVEAEEPAETAEEEVSDEE